MNKIELKRFTNFGVLMRIQAYHLGRFFGKFKDEMLAKNCRLPITEPGSESYAQCWASLLTRLESLPESLVDAVMAIEELAANRPRLEDVIFRGRKYGILGIDNSCTMESQALQLWLWCPYRFGSNLAEVEAKIESARIVCEEKDTAERDRQAKEDEKRKLMEGECQGKLMKSELRVESGKTEKPSPLIPLPSDGRGEPLDGRGKRQSDKGSKSWKTVGAILPAVKIDADASLIKYFTSYQINWIQAEDAIHALNKQVFALAEKSVRIGWTHADSFKNVRKRLRYKDRDYLFVTKDYPSALEYMRQALKFAEYFNFTKAIVSHGEDGLKVDRLDEHGHKTGFTDEIKMGYIKFDNGSCIRAFSSHPQAMAVYGGDVGLDEFAKHPNARLLWETAQSRVTWAYDMAVWSAHDGENTLFYEFAQEARAGRGPWNLYYRVTMIDAIEMGLLKVINRVRGTSLKPESFLADCKSRSRREEIYEQSYLCNPAPSAEGIVEWSAIEHCRCDYQIERVDLEEAEIVKEFGAFRPEYQHERARRIREFLCRRFQKLFKDNKGSKNRLGFDVAASGEGDLMVIYIDEQKGSELWLRGLFTCRTEDWDFIKTVLFTFMQELRYMRAAGDETGLGKQVCWEAAKAFPGRFAAVNFSSRKQDIGLSLMMQLATAAKRFPRDEQDIAMDYFALRKTYHGSRWIFTEGNNTHNPASHCDIAWAGGLATEANNVPEQGIGAMTW